MVIVNTGNGKGKSTAAIGTAIRALGWGWKIFMVQFMKGKWDTGEKRFIEKIGPDFTIVNADCGFSWNSTDTQSDIEACRTIWEKAKGAINGEEYDLVILDEINVVLHLNYLPMSEVIETVRNRPSWKHIILTGRNASPEMIEAADCVSEIKNIKHPFDSGKVAQKGIDF